MAWGRLEKGNWDLKSEFETLLRDLVKRRWSRQQNLKRCKLRWLLDAKLLSRVLNPYHELELREPQIHHLDTSIGTQVTRILWDLQHYLSHVFDIIYNGSKICNGPMFCMYIQSIVVPKYNVPICSVPCLFNVSLGRAAIVLRDDLWSRRSSTPSCVSIAAPVIMMNG